MVFATLELDPVVQQMTISSYFYVDNTFANFEIWVEFAGKHDK